MTPNDYFEQLITVQCSLVAEQEEQINAVAKLLYRCWKSRRRLLLVGNGGSQAILSHAVCDWSKGLAQASGGHGMDAQAWGDNVALASAWSNDTAYQCAMERWVYSNLTENDYLLGMSVSGTSNNVHNAISAARTIDATTILVKGNRKDPIDRGAGGHLQVIVPSSDFQLVEDCFASLIHLWYRMMADQHVEEAKVPVESFKDGGV